MVDRVSRGEPVTITRAGKPVAELRSVVGSALTAEILLHRWRHLPHVDPRALRADLDTILVSDV